jgi:hypothetical protein
MSSWLATSSSSTLKATIRLWSPSSMTTCAVGSTSRLPAASPPFPPS